MKTLKWIALLSVAVFPYSWFMWSRLAEITPIKNVWTYANLFWLAGLAGAVTLLLLRGNGSGRELARAGMAVKLVQIPAYVMWFMLGAALFLFMGPLLAFTVDVMAITLSGLVGLAAVLRCRKEGRLTRRQALLHGVLQFVFCADVFSAVWVYRKSKEVLV